MALLFIPILCGLKYLYPWAWPVLVHADPVLINKRAYLQSHRVYDPEHRLFPPSGSGMATALASWSAPL